MYCHNCGTQIDDQAVICVHCGVKTVNAKTLVDPQAKSKLVAGLLGIFLGALGIHNFYLGYTQKAIVQLLLSTVGWIAFGLGPLIATVWGLIEGIQILTGSISTDAEGRELRD